jgi:restriction endonuclease S subunit
LLVLTKRKSDLRTFFASVEDTYDTNDKTIPVKVLNQLLSNLASFRIAQNFPASNLGFVADALDTESFQYSKYWFRQNYQTLASADGFTAVPLRDLAHKILRGSAITEDKKAGNIPFVSPGAVRKMMVAKESLSYTTKDKIPNKSVNAELDDIIINSIGNYRGAAALTGTDIVGLPINRHLFLVRPNKNVVLPGYLSVILNSDFVAEQLLDRSSGVIPSLNLKSFDGIYIPLPSMSQQEKIFEEFSQITDAINRAENDLQSLNKNLNHKLNSLAKEASSR